VVLLLLSLSFIGLQKIQDFAFIFKNYCQTIHLFKIYYVV